MKLFIWADPYHVDYGSSMFLAVAETVEQARDLAVHAPAYTFGQFRQEAVAATLRKTLNKKPTRIIDMPCAEWHEWSE